MKDGYLPLGQQDDHLSVVRREINISSYAIVSEILGHGVVDHLPLRARCECSMPLCEEIIDVSLAKRRELRRTFIHGFIVAPSHANSPLDITIRKTATYAAIEKSQFTEPVADL